MRTVKDKVRFIMSTSEQTILPLKKFAKFLESDTNIAIYGDVGVTRGSLNRTYYGLVQALGSDVAISVLTAEDVRHGEWRKKTNLFIVPGGATTPMRACLAAEGSQQIREFVEQGGAYAGFCAGAYFGCSNVEFAKGDPDLERLTQHDLNFCNGYGVGPVYGNYSYMDFWCMRAIPLTVCEDKSLNQLAYYNGGCWFRGVENDKRVEVLATYADKDDRPAVIFSRVGLGRVLLSGLHLEYAPELLTADEAAVHDTREKLTPENEKRLLLLKTFLHKLLR